MIDDTGVRQPTDINDRVPRDAPGAREIGFSMPARYNASAILFDNLDAGRGDRVAVTGPAGVRSYRELCADACRAAHAFTAAGLEPGDRVLVLLDDRPEYPAVLFGALRAGLVPLLINTQSTADLLGYFLADAGARVAVTESAFAGKLDAAGREHGLERLLVVDADSGGGDPPRRVDWRSATADMPDTFAAVETGRDAMAFWMYSSGSTGRPKGVVHLHHDMAYTAQSYFAHRVVLGADDVCYSPPKIFFAYGLGNSITAPFSVGASSVLVPGQPTPAAVFDAIDRYRPTLLFGLPTLYTALARHAGTGAASLSSLRLCISAAEILSAEVAAAWRNLCGLDIVEGLGSTELLHIYLSNTVSQRKTGSAGQRVPGYELRLVTPEGREAADGEEGILWVRGDSSAPCYWGRPDKTAETMREAGWIHTGDRFVRDADGFYFFRGRADDLVKVSGQWVYPLEVELCLAEHPDVVECAVLARALADQRTTLKAFVVLADATAADDATTRRLQDYVKEQLLPYKYPRVVAYVDALPKTGTGKIDRQALKQSD